MPVIKFLFFCGLSKIQTLGNGHYPCRMTNALPLLLVPLLSDTSYWHKPPRVSSGKQLWYSFEGAIFNPYTSFQGRLINLFLLFYRNILTNPYCIWKSRIRRETIDNKFPYACLLPCICFLMFLRHPRTFCK